MKRPLKLDRNLLEAKIRLSSRVIHGNKDSKPASEWQGNIVPRILEIDRSIDRSFEREISERRAKPKGKLAIRPGAIYSRVRVIDTLGSLRDQRVNDAARVFDVVCARVIGRLGPRAFYKRASGTERARGEEAPRRRAVRDWVIKILIKASGGILKRAADNGLGTRPRGPGSKMGPKERRRGENGREAAR